MTKQRNTRRFNYDGPIAYQGSLYPSTQMDIEDDKGNVSSRNVFADASGQYYTLNEEGNAIPIILQNNLDEVTVTAPRNRRNTFNDYLTMSNDATKVFNVPHREYNPHLREAAIRGAESHALWEKEHPIATAWGNALTSVPFAVVATPLAMAAGDALAESAMGQYIGNGLSMIANAASNSSWFPWADTLASSYFAAHGLQDMANGKFTPETAMEVMPLMQMAKPMYRAGKDAYNVGKELNNVNKFKSELDWSSESWFGKYRPKEYDASDIAALKSHIPELHQIEKQAKAKGTWLKMPDGSTWEGDPRGWVMLQSKNVRNKYRDEVLHHGENTYFDDMSFYTDENGNNMTGDMLGDRVVWTSTNPNVAYTYGKDVYPFVIPKDASIKTIANAEGRFWNEVLPNTKTDNLVYPNLTEDNVIRINNVVDPGENAISIVAKAKDALPNETVSDYISRKYIGDDMVLGQNVRRKSLYGNNGNFDLSTFNIFKGLVPIGIGLSGKSLYDSGK